MLSKLNRRALAGTKAEILAEAIRVDQEWNARYAELEAKFVACQGYIVADLRADLSIAEDENARLERELDKVEIEAYELRNAHEHHPLCAAYTKDRPGECICSNFELSLEASSVKAPPLSQLTN